MCKVAASSMRNKEAKLTGSKMASAGAIIVKSRGDFSKLSLIETTRVASANRAKCFLIFALVLP